MSSIIMREDWIECELGEVCDIISGKNQKEVLTTDGKYPIYGSGGIFGRANSYLCEAGTTVIGRKGTINSPIYVSEKFWNVDTAFGISPLFLMDNKYVHFFCLGFNFKKLDRSTTIPSLAKTDIAKISFPLAPLPIQRAIVSKIEALFSDLDNGIANFKKAQEQLKVYRQAVLKKAFEGGFSSITNEESITNYELRIRNYELRMRNKENQENHTNQKNHSSDNLPEGWKWVKLGDISKKIQIGPFGSQLHREDYVENGVPLINPMHIKDGKIFPDFTFSITDEKRNSLPNYILQTGDIVLGRRGEMGRCGLVKEKENGWFCGTGSLFIRPNQKQVNPSFLHLLLGGAEIKKYLQENAAGTTMANLNSKIVNEIPLKLPPTIQEQTQIVQEIESRLSVTDNLEFVIRDSIEKAEALRQSILKKAFEGKLLSEAEIEQCKKEADYEPAGELLKKIANEKLQIANEKLRMTNEKLRIANEKLRIANGKLQITNEKLRMTKKKKGGKNGK